MQGKKLKRIPAPPMRTYDAVPITDPMEIAELEAKLKTYQNAERPVGTRGIPGVSKWTAAAELLQLAGPPSAQSRILILTSSSYADEFARCCRDYSSLHMAVAWCSSPQQQSLPYKYIEKFGRALLATIGTSFNRTHPDAIEWFGQIKADIRVFQTNGALFHPKVYVFTRDDHYAVFAGSSNFTYGGFYTNVEVNTLIEGSLASGNGEYVRALKDRLNEWHSDKCSFEPTREWLSQYRKAYESTAASERESGIPTPSSVEEEIPAAAWLQHADWDVYYGKIVEGLRQRDLDGEEYHKELNAAARELPLPWRTAYFDDKEKRRIIGGITPQYGWLGHVAASGRFRGLMAKGTMRQREVIVGAINRIANMNPPIPWHKLKLALDELAKLGFTMKVWSRLLCIVRPDTYCTVASTSVRRKLAKTLGLTQHTFERPDGYIQLLKLIHSSPWFRSTRPEGPREAAVWDRRVAFLDAIFY
jgi:hypothetical protein